MTAVQTALVVDDSRSARYVLQRLLEHRHIRVDLAETAQQAFSYLRDHKPDVVFMDDMLPGMDGREAIERLAADPATADIPVIMYTAQEAAELDARGTARGIVGVLSKPFTETQINTLLAKLDAVAPEARALAGRPPSVSRLQRVAGATPETSETEPDSLHGEMAALIKAETRSAVEQWIGEALEDQLAMQLRAHKNAMRQSLDELRADQQRFQSQVLEQRLPRLLGILEQRLEQRANRIEKILNDRMTNGSLGPKQRTQVANIARSEAVQAAHRPARQAARQVAAELMRSEINALNLRLERVRRRVNMAIGCGMLALMAAGILGYVIAGAQ
jgi:CheY-like chemotaxis protein